MDKLRWGILGTGNIASQFARGLEALPEHELVGVGSRSQASADRFGEQFDVSHRHASYEALAADAEVDAVYIATPHHLHRDNSILCLEAGKHVLCEKPFTINAAQAEEVIAVARQRGLFLMEAMWTRFFPIMVRLRALLAEGVIGDLLMLQSDFGFRIRFNPEHRLFDPAMGGGATLDVGVYPISLASMLFGAPKEIRSLAHLGQTGVDEQAAMILGYEGGRMALMSTAVRVSTPQEAFLLGSQGQIKIHYQWWYPTHMTISKPGQEDQEIHLPYEGNGYNYEAAEVLDCLNAGKLESDVMPLDETVSIMRTMDTLREQWGLRYPME
jgi:predicted dehydrogenase